MLISHRHKFIFIHVQKTGGTSISKALEPYCERSLQEHNRLGLRSHATAAEIRQKVGDEVWNSYFKFAFERNPWDRTLSGYYYQLQEADQFRKYYWPAAPTFTQWMFPLGFIPKKLVPTFDMYAIRNHIAVDFVGKYESLSDDFAVVCKEIGLQGVTLPLANKSVLRPDAGYRAAYTRRTKNRVARVYHREIKQFEYSF